MDSEGEKYKRDIAKAEAVYNETAANRRLKYLAKGGDSKGPKVSLSDQAWLAIWGSLALVVSLAVGGYIWWLRIHARARAVLLALAPKPARPDSGGKEEQPLRRRAA